MKWKKVMAMGCVVVMVTSAMTGCSTATTNTTENTEEADQQEEAVVMQVTAVDGDTVTGDLGTLESQGGAPDGQAPGGEKPDGEAPNGDNAPSGDSQQTPPEKPDGDNDSSSSDSQNQQTPPEKPDGDSSNAPTGEAPSGEKPSGQAPSGEAPSGDSQQTPPEKPDGDNNGSASDGQAPDGNGAPSGGAPGGSTFTASGESTSFTVTDSTTITVEFLQGSQEGTIDNITVGSVLEVTTDADGNALTVVVKNLNAGGGFGGSGEVTNGTSANTIDEDGTVTGESYASTGDDENALRVDGATVTLDGITVSKSAGSSSNTEDGDFYGQNAALLALNGAQVTITGADVSSSAVNGNGVFSYGEGTTVNISDSKIRTTERNSGGIQTTGGGTTNATNLDVQTEGDSSAAIRSDRGGGTVNVDGGTYVTNGTGSPAVYSTADITVKNAELTANASEGVVVEGANKVALENCDVTSNMTGTYNGDSDENMHGIMIYQSMSGDADMGTAEFRSVGGSITAKTGDLFYVTNTDCEIYLEDTELNLEDTDGVLFRIEGNSGTRGWGTAGSNGGTVKLTAEKQKMDGDILVDDISSLDLLMENGTVFTGSINASGEAGTVNVTLTGESTWTLTEDSYVTSFDGDLSNVTANGHHLYVNGEQVL